MSNRGGRGKRVEKQAQRTVRVQNLPPSLSESDLRSCLETCFGPLVRCSLGGGVAHVVFKKRRHAQAADVAGFADVVGGRVSISAVEVVGEREERKPERGTTVFLTGVVPGWDEHDVAAALFSDAYFSRHLLKIEIVRSAGHLEKHGHFFAFVHFDREDAAERAIAELDGAKVDPKETGAASKVSLAWGSCHKVQQAATMQRGGSSASGGLAPLSAAAAPNPASATLDEQESLLAKRVRVVKKGARKRHRKAAAPAELASSVSLVCYSDSDPDG